MASFYYPFAINLVLIAIFVNTMYYFSIKECFVVLAFIFIKMFDLVACSMIAFSFLVFDVCCNCCERNIIAMQTSCLWVCVVIICSIN